MSAATRTTKSHKLHLRLLNYTPAQTQNPYVILTHDLVRNTKTLHYTIQTSQPPRPEREHSKSMRGYFGMMSENSCDVNGNGERVKIDNAAKHLLWQPRNEGTPKEEPLWHLRVSVLKDQEGRGDAPSRRFVSLFIVPHQWLSVSNRINRHSSQCTTLPMLRTNLRRRSAIHSNSASVVLKLQTPAARESMMEGVRTSPLNLIAKQPRRDGHSSWGG
jgi:hypothetical protein